MTSMKHRNWTVDTGNILIYFKIIHLEQVNNERNKGASIIPVIISLAGGRITTKVALF